MNNPISNNSVFDSRELIDYRDYIEDQLMLAWNEANEEEFPAETIADIFDTNGYEYVDDAKEAFAAFEEEYEEEITHYKEVSDFCEEFYGYGDFEWGEAIIPESEFTDYCKELVMECGYISGDLPTWVEIDWEATADNMRADYMEADFEGETYLMRA